MNKKLSIPLILMIMVFLIVCPAEATDVVKNTLMLWYSKVLPSLLPTMILVKMILNSNIKIKRVQPFCVVSGILCGFPIGATTSLNCVRNGKLSREKGLMFATLFNQFSPAFLASYIGMECLGESPIVVLSVLYGAQIVLYLLLHLTNRSKEQHYIHCEPQKNETFPTDVNYKVVDASILSSCEALVKICGYMILCTLINAMIYQIGKNAVLQALLAPTLEMTSGVATLIQTSLPYHLRYSLLFAFVSFGGISGLLQVQSMVRESGISMLKYTSVKMISAVLTGLIAYLYYSISH